MVDVHFDRVAFNGRLPAVQALFELLARKHAAPGLQQHQQHRKLAGRHLDRFAILHHRARSRVHFDIPVADGGRGPARGTAQQRTQACVEFIDIKGFDQIVVGALVEAGNALADLIAGRHDQHRRGGVGQRRCTRRIATGRARAQTVQQFAALAVGQPQVQ